MSHTSERTYFEYILRRACHRLKVVEVGRGVALVISFVLIVLLVGISYDHVFTLTFSLRLVAHLALTCVAPVIGLYLVLLPAVRRLSRLYVAGRIERSGEGFHHTLVSYLEARQDPSVPPDVVAALAQRASEDVQGLALEKAIDEKPFFRANAALLGVLVLFFVFSVLTEKHVPTSMQRILHPFTEIAPPTRVRIYQVIPGSVELTSGDPLNITVRTGRWRPNSVVASISVLGSVWRSIELAPLAEGSLWGGVVESVDKDFVYRIIADDAQSPLYRVTTFPPPIIESMKLTCVYPEYMDLPPRTFIEGDIAAPIGTRVEFELASSNELEAAWLEVDDDVENLRVSPTNLAVASGTFMLTGDAAYSVHLRDVRGVLNDPPVYRITARPDRPPEIEMTGSAPAVVVRELKPVDLKILSTDDFGLDSVKLYYRVNDEKTAVRTHQARRGTKELHVAERLELGRLLPKKGDALTFFAEAEDRRQPDPNVVRTETFVISYAGSAELSSGSRASPPEPDNAVEKATADRNDAETEETGAEPDDPGEERNESDPGDRQREPVEREDVARDEDKAVLQIAEALQRLEQRKASEATAAEGATPRTPEESGDESGEPADGSQGRSTSGDEQGAKDSAATAAGSSEETASGESQSTDGEGERGQGEEKGGSSSETSQANTENGLQGEARQGPQSASVEGPTVGSAKGESSQEESGQGSQKSMQGGTSSSASSSREVDSREGEESGSERSASGEKSDGAGGEAEPSSASADRGTDASQKGADSGDRFAEEEGQSGGGGEQDSRSAQAEGESGGEDTQESRSSQGAGQGESKAEQSARSAQGGGKESAVSTAGRSSGGGMYPAGEQATGGLTGSSSVEYAESDAEVQADLVEEVGQTEDSPHAERIAAELKRVLMRGDVDEEFLQDVGMSREQLASFVKAYERIRRPRRSQENGDEPPVDKEPSPDAVRTTSGEGVVLGRAVGSDARHLSAGEIPESKEKSDKDLFRDFGENISPEYRDVIEAYYRELATQDD